MFDGLFTAHRPDPGYPAHVLRVLRRQYLQRPVDTARACNNSRYVLLQDVVGHVTTQAFDAYTCTDLFSPMRSRLRAGPRLAFTFGPTSFNVDPAAEYHSIP